MQAVEINQGLGHLIARLDAMTLSALGLKWSRSPETGNHELKGATGSALPTRFFVFKSLDSQWGTAGGSCVKSLKKGKTQEEMRLKATIAKELEEFQAFLGSSRPIGLVTDEESVPRFGLSNMAYKALSALLDQILRERVQVVSTQCSFLSVCPANNMLGDALAGFDVGDLKLMFVSCKVNFSYTGGDFPRGIRPDGLAMSVNTLINSSRILEEHPAFADFPSFRVTTLDECPLVRKLDSWIVQAIRVAESTM